LRRAAYADNTLTAANTDVQVDSINRVHTDLRVGRGEDKKRTDDYQQQQKENPAALLEQLLRTRLGNTERVRFPVILVPHVRLE
jgi:hypothetical protein